MANDRHVIQYMSPAELVGLMNATGVVTVHDTITADGKPVIHAALKVVNAETGEHLPGGLPFSVVMFKSQNEPGYSNIAIGTIVPASELSVVLPRDYFNFCNQRFRFCRVFPVDERSFVIQMDLVLKNATREYVKFAFGLWGALFSQMLFELMGRRRESLATAAEAYAQAHTDFAQQIAATPDTAIAEPVPEPVAEPVPAPEEAVTETEAEPAVLPLEAETILAQEPDAEAVIAEEASVEKPIDAPAIAETVTTDVPAEDVVATDLVADEVAEVTSPVDIAVEAPDTAMETADLELSIAAGPVAEAMPEAEPEPEPAPEPEVVAPASELAEATVVVEREDAKEVVPA